MRIQATNLGKRFHREWIFRQLDLDWESNHAYAILGGNGSGKSTLLQVLSGFVTPSAGELKHLSEGNELSNKQLFRLVSIATPYLDLFEDMTLTEAVAFHGRFKTWRNQLTPADVMEQMMLAPHQKKLVRHFSSGMRQRLRLGLAVLSDTPILLLDEPTSNLDAQGIEWYRNSVQGNRNDRLVVVCSNRQKQEYDFCDQEMVMEDFKRKK